MNLELSINQTANLIANIAGERTVLVQGDMGSGKSTLLRILASMEKFKDHVPVYFDATTKDLGDLMVPMFDKVDSEAGLADVPVVRYAVNEEFGIHHGKPVILMIDEIGKANPAVKNGLTRVMLEREIGSYKLPEGSLVFATTNHGAENVGDMLAAHTRNRLVVVSMRKATGEEWIRDFAIPNGLDTALMAFCQENPQLFHSFRDVSSPQDNLDIYHPQDPSRVSFFSPRSAHAASDILLKRELMDDMTLRCALSGTIGEHAAGNLMAYTAMVDQLPKRDEIKTDPMNAKVPTSPAAVCMVVYRALQTLERPEVIPFLQYMNRLAQEAQALFGNGLRNVMEAVAKGSIQTDSAVHKRALMVYQTREYADWAMANGYMYSADK
jgi:energy-coupling factor transporter ATP-binding protein EcfA2